MRRVPQPLRYLVRALQAGVARLDLSLNPMVTLRRLSKYPFTIYDSIWIFHAVLAIFWLTLMTSPGFPAKLLIPILYITGVLIPLTSQFLIPATPVLAWVMSWFCSRFIPSSWRPDISIVLLPTLETVLYGANISDILTRFTHTSLDIIAWLPYGVFHFAFPAIVAVIFFLFRSKPVLPLWAKVFGYLNLFGVFVQILFPCAPPWYEVIHGLTPADYTMKGSPGGLVRIDRLFGGNGYTTGFSNSPVVFGAFPSLHAGNATLEALFISHFFPNMTKWAWGYAAVLYWATMYLTHHYLIDVVGGACLAIAFFYIYLPDELRGKEALAPPANLGGSRNARQKYEEYGLESPGMNGRSRYPEDDFEVGGASDSDLDEADLSYYRSPLNTPKTNGSSGGAGSNGKAKRSHRHTASIASLIRGEERAPEDGWSPITTSFPVEGAPNGTGTGRPHTPSGRPRTPGVGRPEEV